MKKGWLLGFQSLLSRCVPAVLRRFSFWLGFQPLAPVLAVCCCEGTDVGRGGEATEVEAQEAEREGTYGFVAARGRGAQG